MTETTPSRQDIQRTNTICRMTITTGSTIWIKRGSRLIEGTITSLNGTNDTATINYTTMTNRGDECAIPLTQVFLTREDAIDFYRHQAETLLRNLAAWESED